MVVLGWVGVGINGRVGKSVSTGWQYGVSWVGFGWRWLGWFGMAIRLGNAGLTVQLSTNKTFISLVDFKQGELDQRPNDKSPADHLAK